MDRVDSCGRACADAAVVLPVLEGARGVLYALSVMQERCRSSRATRAILVSARARRLRRLMRHRRMCFLVEHTVDAVASPSAVSTWPTCAPCVMRLFVNGAQILTCDRPSLPVSIL